MGCLYPSDILDSKRNELIIERKSNNKFLLSKNQNSFNSNNAILKRKKLNLYSTQKIRDFKKQTFNENSLELNDDINSKLNNTKYFISRLSLQKFNELFDDSDIDFYTKPIIIKNHAFNYKNINNWNINYSRQSLNSTLENTIEKRNKRKNIRKCVKK